MQNILILGAGLSATSMIDYLLKQSEIHHWKIKLGDLSKELAEDKLNAHPNGEALQFDIYNEEQKEELVQWADVVISMLPASFHFYVAETCVKFSKHMITASYVSNEMKELHEQAQEKNVLLLNEIGVDPGIDHMSAMQVINEIKRKGGELSSFKSFTGGLVAPEYDTNPWHYKFTWNPRNVVVAGQSTAMYMEENEYKYIPYQSLFTRTEKLNILDLGEFEMYPNRDSLSYRETYKIDDIPSILRGTLRRPGFSEDWNVFIQLGLTDDSYFMKNTTKMTWRAYTNSFLPYHAEKTVEEKFAEFAGIELDSERMQKFIWLGLFEKKKIKLENASPAQILQKRLMEKWALEEGDKDMIVMQHQFEYELEGKKKNLSSSMMVRGKDTRHTAMAITVGIPVGIACKLLMLGEIKARGVVVPTKKEIYEPVLKELEEFGIKFIEEELE
jgi:saccharopine dehydrogenase (NADP+, L-glutamate forming)